MPVKYESTTPFQSVVTTCVTQPKKPEWYYMRDDSDIENEVPLMPPQFCTPCDLQDKEPADAMAPHGVLTFGIDSDEQYTVHHIPVNDNELVMNPSVVKLILPNQVQVDPCDVELD